MNSGARSKQKRNPVRRWRDETFRLCSPTAVSHLDCRCRVRYDTFLRGQSALLKSGESLSLSRKRASRSKSRPVASAVTSKGGASNDATVDPPRLLDIVAAFSRQTIAVIGDFVLDEFVSGEISRVSREAPVLILRHRRSESYPGGAANAANNLADLGARVLPVGVVGDDEGGRALLDLFRRKRIDTAGIVRAGDWITPRKTRYLAGWTHTTEQQVLRVDREPDGTLSPRVQESLERKARDASRPAEAVLVSDYGFGVVDPARVRGLGAKRLMLDSRYRLLEYGGARVTAATPNEPEIEAAYHARIGTDAAKLEEL